jgi:hypothetical protein
MTVLFSPPDVEAAHEAFGANCGPCALAALLGVPVADVRRGFPAFPARPWCSPTQMLDALRLLGRRGVSKPNRPGNNMISPGLAHIQWTGPWTAAGASPRWAYRHTHWISVACTEYRSLGVYDVNVGHWTTASAWAEKVVPYLLEDVPRADGGWWVRTTIEVYP